MSTRTSGRILYVETVGTEEAERYEVRELLPDGDHSVLAIVYTDRPEAVKVMGLLLRD